MKGAPCSGEAAAAHHIGVRRIQSLLELELELDAGVLAGAGAGVEALDELPESPLDDDDDDAGAAAAAELSDDPAFDDDLEPPRLSVL